MVIVKRLYTFMLQRFLPLFAMTFFITLFIVMMQFLFRYIDDLVGKGLEISVIFELFFYAAVTMVPTALPLSILLASLMTFGNLGEKFELTAMKASGISLFRIMRPLIILIAGVAVGAFFFQNDVLPIAQTKMWTLMFSIRQKTPEVEIPEKSFYNQLPGMNLYVEHKDRETGRLDGVIIYDTSRGMDKVRVILADSARISFTEDKSKVRLQLYNGEMYEDFRDNVMGSQAGRNMPFRRENFSTKTAFIAYDANFNRMDDSLMRQQYIGKNIAELKLAIDSIQQRVDSIGHKNGVEMKERAYVNVPYYETKYIDHKAVKVVREPVSHEPLDIDSVFHAPNPDSYTGYLSMALNKAKRSQNEYEFRSLALDDEQKSLRRHEIEMHKKFTLSLACLIFFFIGAPLGAIIKKGGLGMPLIISVMLFIVYYIFDNTGYKMARDGKMDVIAGIWLSTFVMLPLGAFFTYKAVGDTTMFDFEMYRRLWRDLCRRLGYKFANDKQFKMKEVTIYDVEPAEATRLIDEARSALNRYAAVRGRFSNFIAIPRAKRLKQEFKTRLTDMTSYLANTRDHNVIKLLNTLPVLIEPRTVTEFTDTLDKLYRIYNPETETGTESLEKSNEEIEIESLETDIYPDESKPVPEDKNIPSDESDKTDEEND